MNNYNNSSKEVQWVQNILKEKEIIVNSIDDFKDSVIIIELLQVITNRPITKYFKKPRTRIQSIENASIALNFMKNNSFQISTLYSPQDIADGNEKTIKSIIYIIYLFGQGKKLKISRIRKNSRRIPFNADGMINQSITTTPISSNKIDNEEIILEDTDSEEEDLHLDSIHDDDGDTTEEEDNINNSDQKRSPIVSSTSSFEAQSSTSSLSSLNSVASTSVTGSSTNSTSSWKRESRQSIVDNSSSGRNSRRFSGMVTRSAILSLKSPLMSASSGSIPNMNNEEASGDSSSLSTSSLPTPSQGWFKVKVDEKKKEKPITKVPLLVKISPVDFDRYNNPDFLGKIVDCQRFIRGYKSRKVLKQRKKFNNHRNRCFGEILSTEETYVQCVEMIVNIFYKQIMWNAKVSPTPYLTMPDINTIFSTINQIFSFNSDLLSQLRKVNETWSHYQKVGDIFLSAVPYMKLYKQYCLNYDTAILCLQKAKKNQTFNLFIKACLDHPENKMKQSLESLLITVVQRIPRYILLINDLLSHTWKDHPDYENLQNALRKIQSVASEVNKSIKIAELQSKVLEIQKSLVGWDEEKGELVQPTRLFVKQGYILDCQLDTRFSKDLQKLTYFLFNNAILITEKENSSHRFQLKYFFDLNDPSTKLKDIEDSQVIKNSFQLILGRTTAFLATENNDEKSYLLNHIQNCKQSKQNRPSTIILDNNNSSSTNLIKDTEKNNLENNNGENNINNSLENLDINNNDNNDNSNNDNDNINNNSNNENSDNTNINNENNNINNENNNLEFNTDKSYTVIINKSESKKEAGKKEYTVYNISISDDETGECFNIVKRYSDFDNLNKKLTKKFPTEKLKDLPKKHYINSLGSNTVESRRLMLEVYLQHLFQIESIKQSIYLKNFISQPSLNEQSAENSQTTSPSSTSPAPTSPVTNGKHKSLDDLKPYLTFRLKKEKSSSKLKKEKSNANLISPSQSVEELNNTNININTNTNTNTDTDTDTNMNTNNNDN
ncbi:hypothetical protein DICPUDRAFT_153591 [Dictyostelium purpureum]|uniref:DH domain-containing protein n=1 Tax=Dictyostelium purpureum TaxID=5786 RepID=F0ZP99_DICPU|nr:uncharacterized protein DICPUDRAFT_153591 [Dictyostelium purpureum]EGC34238.1 hypothetical protein DICPUDRAFT_153591 [Dictyostelium purpureum]|eukprot:XP_003289248.1 hypothetical protein DICPUDRAFT_153591 [Dictyostelium purpureum]